MNHITCFYDEQEQIYQNNLTNTQLKLLTLIGYSMACLICVTHDLLYVCGSQAYIIFEWL